MRQKKLADRQAGGHSDGLKKTDKQAGWEDRQAGRKVAGLGRQSGRLAGRRTVTHSVSQSVSQSDSVSQAGRQEDSQAGSRKDNLNRQAGRHTDSRH